MYYMLDRLSEQERSIELYVTESNVKDLTQNQWNLLEATLAILQPFDEITKVH